MLNIIYKFIITLLIVFGSISTSNAEDELFFDDDLWISICINKILKKDIENLSFLLKESFFRRGKSIYKKHTKIDALIEMYSSNRREARNLRFIENCKEYLSLKHETKNFTDL